MAYDLQSPEIKDLAAALAKAQLELRAATKDKENPFFRSKYADLTEVMEACREPLAKNGLAITQGMAFEGDRVVLVTTLMHMSGQWIRGFYPINPVKNDPQSTGSATTYARRYSLSAMVGIVTEEDDDGEAAQGRGKQANQGRQANAPKIESKPRVESAPAKTSGDEPPNCKTCNAGMLVAKSGKHWYCPNWNDGRQHNAVRIPKKKDPEPAPPPFDSDEEIPF